MAALALLVAMAIPGTFLVAGDKRQKKKKAAAPVAANAKGGPQIAEMDESKRAQHALNRLAFGPRPGEVERVSAMGVDKWIELQLHPEKIEDGALQARLEPFRTLKMDTVAMLQAFPPPQVLKAVADGKLPMPRDPEKRAVYQTQIAAYKERRQNKAEKGNDPFAPKNAKNAGEGDDQAMMKTDGKAGDAKPNADAALDDLEQFAKRREARVAADEKADSLMKLPAEQRLKEIIAMQPRERRVLTLAASPEKREKLLADFTPAQRETVMALGNPQQVVTGELQQAKVLRAIYSERQLEEVMTDFWFNHFNVFMNKGADRYMITSYERDVIRPHAFGKFKDLLMATAKSPAMLFYLDNWQSVGPNSIAGLRSSGKPVPADMRTDTRPQMRPQHRGFFGTLFGGGRGRNRGGFGGNNNGGFGRPGQQQRPMAQQQANGKGVAGQPKAPRGLNENYAREVMELHTLGVNGGYTQADVTELARVFTGWTLKQPRLGGSYEFDDRRHEPGTKTVLGRAFNGGGEREGEQALEMLAANPATAKFISRKLAMRFVSDNPPDALVERMAARFTETDGDLREVLRTLFHSPEFWAADAYRAKVKTPLEFVASAARATGVEVTNAMPLAQQLNRMGMQLYGMQPPTGYSMKAEAWVNSAALLNRMNFALALGSGKLPGSKFEPERVLQGKEAPKDQEGALAVLAEALLSGDISRQTRDTIRKQLDDPKYNGMANPGNAGLIAGMVMGSPEFQRR